MAANPFAVMAVDETLTIWSSGTTAYGVAVSAQQIAADADLSTGLDIGLGVLQMAEALVGPMTLVVPDSALVKGVAKSGGILAVAALGKDIADIARLVNNDTLSEAERDEKISRELVSGFANLTALGGAYVLGLGCVDKRDSQAGRVLIQGCSLGSSHGPWGLVGCGMGADRPAAAI